MRIAYFYTTQQFDTGSPHVLAGIVDALDRERHTPLFLATGEGPLVDALEARGVEIIPAQVGDISWRHPFEAARRIAGSAALLRRIGADVLHVNEFGWNLDIVLGAALARMPVVLHVHNPLDVAWQNVNRLAATRVLFVSEAHRRSTTNLARIEAKSAVLYNPVDIERFAAGRSIRASLGLSADDVVVTAVCQITPNKDLGALLDVARELIPQWPTLQFVVAGRAGEGHEAYAEEVIAAAAEPPLAGRIRFLGSRGDIPDVLASSDIFFLPTRSETFGMVVAEAMAASLPVVTTRVGGIREIVRDSSEGWVLEPGDIPGFASALEVLIASPERRRAMGRTGRASLDGRFDRATFARALELIYAGL
ncbi:MAG TPA: glycosyltransferase family 4 protein [Gemmatimonadales bacterium]|nr:glycosyltransferase family 4 protein [Gemmatimonadales bacterium]